LWQRAKADKIAPQHSPLFFNSEIVAMLRIVKEAITFDDVLLVPASPTAHREAETAKAHRG